MHLIFPVLERLMCEIKKSPVLSSPGNFVKLFSYHLIGRVPGTYSMGIFSDMLCFLSCLYSLVATCIIDFFVIEILVLEILSENETISAKAVHRSKVGDMHTMLDFQCVLNDVCLLFCECNMLHESCTWT